MGRIHQQFTNEQVHLLLVLRQVIICRFAEFGQVLGTPVSLRVLHSRKDPRKDDKAISE